MTFDKWWTENGRDFSPHAIPDEIKWFAEKAWNAALLSQEDQHENEQHVKRGRATACEHKNVVSNPQSVWCEDCGEKVSPAR